MATLDDKLLGEKLHYYCSSSEDEEDENTKRGNGTNKTSTTFIPNARASEWEGSSTNTGPKGVLKDWQRFKQLENEKREEQEAEKLAIMKKLSLTCQSHNEEQKQAAEEAEVDREIQGLLKDDFLTQYMQQRMQEMMGQAQLLRTHGCPKFGRLFRLTSGPEFLDAVDKEKKSVTVIIHIYSKELSSCEAMNGCLACLSQDYPHVKFCCLEASSAGMSRHFEMSGVPALLAYKSGSLIGNFVRLSDEFAEDFFAGDVESFLVEHGLLPDQSLVPEVIRDRIKTSTEEDSDFDVE